MKIIFTRWFLIFWSISFIASWFMDGILGVAFTVLVLLVMASHEYAHATECNRFNAPIKAMTFTLLGGQVEPDLDYAQDIIDVMLAGLKDTGMYTAYLGIVLVYLYTYRPIGVNYAGNPYLNFLDSVFCFLVIMFVSNILPISYKHKIHGTINTDGWGAWKMRELRDELWNDGKAMSMKSEVNENGGAKESVL